MKKILLFSFAGILALTFNCERAIAKIKIGVEFTLGHGDGCPKKGVCKFTIVVGPAISAMIPGTLTLDEDAGSLVLSFSEKDVNTFQPEKIDDLKGQTTYHFDAPWVLSDDLIKELHFSGPITIPAGGKQLRYSNGTYSIIMQL